MQEVRRRRCGVPMSQNLCLSFKPCMLFQSSAYVHWHHREALLLSIVTGTAEMNTATQTVQQSLCTCCFCEPPQACSCRCSASNASHYENFHGVFGCRSSSNGQQSVQPSRVRAQQHKFHCCPALKLGDGNRQPDHAETRNRAAGLHRR